MFSGNLMHERPIWDCLRNGCSQTSVTFSQGVIEWKTLSVGYMALDYIKAIIFLAPVKLWRWGNVQKVLCKTDCWFQLPVAGRIL